MGLSFPAGSNGSYTITPVIVRDGAGNIIEDAQVQTVVASSDTGVVEVAETKLSFLKKGKAELIATTTIANSSLVKTSDVTITVEEGSESGVESA